MNKNYLILSSVVLLLTIFTTTSITSKFYINKYENIINKNNIAMLETENRIRKELGDKLQKALGNVSELEGKYQDELSKLEEEYSNNSSFIVDSWVFDYTQDESNNNNICGSTYGTCGVKQTQSGIILSKTDVRDSLTLAKEADRVLNELNLCKGFIRTIYESNKM